MMRYHIKMTHGPVISNCSDSEARPSRNDGRPLGLSVPEESRQSYSASLVEPSEELARALRSGANWFYWVAALSLVNTVLLVTGSEWVFFFGLGATQVIDGFSLALGEATGLPFVYLAMAVNAVIAGFVALFGYLSNKRHTWAFIVGMILYSFDGLLFVLVQEWLAVGLHLFVLFGIYHGLSACLAINREAAGLLETGATQAA